MSSDKWYQDTLLTFWSVDNKDAGVEVAVDTLAVDSRLLY